MQASEQAHDSGIRPKILMLAFACEPDEGSEPEVGWKWAHVMSDSCDVTVVTQSKNQPRIERWNQEHPAQNKKIRYSYLELGRAMRWIKKQIPGGMYLYYVLWQWRLRSHLISLQREESFDLIHHVTFASFRMPVWVRGLPVVWGPVGGAEIAPMQLLTGYGTLAGRLRERVRNLNTHLAGKLVWLWDPTRRNKGIALASTPATAKLLERNSIRCALMPTIGYDEPSSGESKFRVQPGPPLRLLFVGRLHLLKGVHLLLEALSKVDSKMAILTIVGNGNERKRLTKLALKLGLEERVTFLGFVPRASLPEIFEAHDVMVAPSLYESGGLSVLEGFSHGLPAIVLDCGGHALSVDAGCGMKVRMDQSQQAVIEDLAAAIKIFSADPELRMQCGLNARMKLKRDYSWQRKHDAMREIYARILADRQDSPSSAAPIPL